jgi:hypothetical protein
MDYRLALEQRLRKQRAGLLTVQTKLVHFALVTYAVPSELLALHIPTDRFEVVEFNINGQPRALVSAVPFLDYDFRFHYFPLMSFQFGQTNYRAYVKDKHTGDHCVWFFGTTLGSGVVNIPRSLWRIPWHRAHYSMDMAYDAEEGRYTRYHMRAKSYFGEMRLLLDDTGTLPIQIEGFESASAMTYILTHPVTGFYYGLDGRLGSYSVWHDVLQLTQAHTHYAYFGVFDRLGLLTREEMLNPLSVLVCPYTDFTVLLPPKRLS